MFDLFVNSYLFAYKFPSKLCITEIQVISIFEVEFILCSLDIGSNY